ncbi:RNA polymerase sigma factor [Actinomadura yumaensis]|uniref:RNA polymerase sigma factor n=1 Tax=Actinomadura yumaensis TaxID=111807 RepID=A0ABW2CR49_9ACTN
MRTAARKRYTDLLRLAYLALDDGTSPSTADGWAVLGRARGAVRRARGASYGAVRRGLVGVLATEPPARPRVTRPRLFVEPAVTPPGPARAALRELSPHERLAFVLCRVEGLTPPEAAAELGDRLLVTAGDVDRALAAVDRASGLGAEAQRAELLAFDPALVRLRPPPRAWPVAVVLAALLAAGALTARGLSGTGRTDDPVLVGPGRWRATGTPTMDDWPARGGLTGDRALLRRAAAAWRADRRAPPLGRAAVLFADRVDGASVVVLRDSPGLGDPPSVAQYFERPLTRGVESVRRLGSPAGQLIMVGTTWRYLVPPWLSDPRVALPSERTPGWRPIGVRNGLTNPVPWRWFTPRCQNYVAVRMVHRPGAGGWPRRLTQLVSHNPGSTAPRVWFRDAGPDDEGFQWAAVRAATCAAAASLTESGDLRIGRLWRGSLPDGGGRATLMTVDVASPWGAPGAAVLIGDDGRALSGRGGTNGDYASPAATTAGAVWWPSRRRWHLVAAAGPSVTRLKTIGDVGGHEGNPLLVPGPPVRGAAPATEPLPVVQVVAYEADGDRTVISPS